MANKGRHGNSKYKEAYCNEVIECLAEGHSVAGFAGCIGVAASVVYEWVKVHEEFAAAYEIAKAKSVYFWEKQHIEITKTGKGNITGSIFGLKNRAHEEWRDIQKVEHGGPNGAPIQVNIAGVDAGLL